MPNCIFHQHTTWNSSRTNFKKSKSLIRKQLQDESRKGERISIEKLETCLWKLDSQQLDKWNTETAIIPLWRGLSALILTLKQEPMSSQKLPVLSLSSPPESRHSASLQLLQSWKNIKTNVNNRTRGSRNSQTNLVQGGYSRCESKKAIPRGSEMEAHNNITRTR